MYVFCYDQIYGIWICDKEFCSKTDISEYIMVIRKDNTLTITIKESDGSVIVSDYNFDCSRDPFRDFMKSQKYSMTWSLEGEKDKKIECILENYVLTISEMETNNDENKNEEGKKIIGLFTKDTHSTALIVATE
jgi:hypothetical protein